MSLIDALLLEPAELKAPTGERAVYIALRADGAAGNGTADDPYSGNTVRFPSIDVTSISALDDGEEVNVSLEWTNTNPTLVTVTTPHRHVAGEYIVISGASVSSVNGLFQIKTATLLTDGTTLLTYEIPTIDEGASSAVCRYSTFVEVTTQSAHGFANGDLVAISGVTGANAAYYNWTFAIEVLTSTSFRCTIAVAPGAPSGTSIHCQKVVYRLDNWLSLQPAATTIHIGPGIFETRGNYPSDWRLKAGQKIVGAGIGCTTLKLIVIGVPNATERYAVFASGYGDNVTSCEVSDLTVDCNFRAHVGTPYSTLHKAAVAVLGYHCRIRRVRAFDCASTVTGVECFVITSGGGQPDYADPLDCIIEDCIGEKPNSATNQTITWLHMFYGERPSDGVAPHLNACVIRHSFVDGTFEDGLVHLDKSMTGLSGEECTVHANRVFNCRYGGPYHDTFSSRDVVSRQNYFYNCATGLYQNFGSPSRRGNGYRNLQSLTRGQMPSGQYFARATVGFLHDLQVGDGVMIQNAVPTQFNSASGSVVIAVAVVSTNPPVSTFDYIPATDPGSNATSAGQFQRMWQARFICDQENHMNLKSNGTPAGFDLLGDLLGPPYVFLNALIQDAVIDDIQFPVGQQEGPTSILCTTAQNVVALGNVSGIYASASGISGIQYGDSQRIAALGNRTFQGESVSVANVIGPVLEIDADGLGIIEEATVFTLL